MSEQRQGQRQADVEGREPETHEDHDEGRPQGHGGPVADNRPNAGADGGEAVDLAVHQQGDRHRADGVGDPGQHQAQGDAREGEGPALGGQEDGAEEPVQGRMHAGVEQGEQDEVRRDPELHQDQQARRHDPELALVAPPGLPGVAELECLAPLQPRAHLIEAERDHRGQQVEARGQEGHQEPESLDRQGVGQQQADQHDGGPVGEAVPAGLQQVLPTQRQPAPGSAEVDVVHGDGLLPDGLDDGGGLHGGSFGLFMDRPSLMGVDAHPSQ